MRDLSELFSAARAEGRVSRRLFLAYGAALSSLPLLGARAEARSRRASFAADPFSLGVASGEPTEGGVVLWTRLAPSPLDPDGGMPPEAVEVAWELATDDGMREIVRSGKAVASPQLAHSVHVEAEGLQPDRWYWYRFRAGDAVSPVGRTRTAPAADAAPERLRFAFASCSHYEQGYFTAYRRLAEEDLDLAFHLGDYIYEGSGRDALVRKHAGPKLRTLADYRIRHAQYKTDPDLQAAHARCPWVVTWDDHEFENNYAAGVSEKAGVDPVEFLEQRARAYQAYYEAMPLRPSSLPHGPHMKLYRTVPFGRLATFQVLDTRQYRTDQPNDDRASELNELALSPKNTILGAEQADWLKAALLRSTGTWNVLAQQVMMGMVHRSRTPGGPELYSMDQWPGYAVERMKLVEFLADRRVPNPVVLTGDIHSNWVNDLRVDDRKPEGAVVAAEFVGTSITSGGDGSPQVEGLDGLLAANPCVRFHNRQRGYVLCTLTPKSWVSDYRIVEKVKSPGAPAKTLKSFAVEAGKPGVQPA
ncbi:alkaline phosphatase D family protein [Paludisphaera mucosa]|uniref:Alkaline phosphatase D family protein n=1 Tax=Paludisphaera mucosa TaxID=3030827 RepID=A0ABT6FB64_9BACT|nr:alkaline phosphatase D family protein [Paludisphaera mucosa]MDG3004830.1 alkaline phosphatase D family protein [Paludisphaera mucosa]